jgi:SAM-dependent methyltransferase
MKSYHDTRLPYDDKREVLWKTLCESYFQRQIPREACVLELGAGYGHFINNIKCAQRIAVDQWEGMRDFLQADVRAHVGSVMDLDFQEPKTVDFAFASNLFEHLSQSELRLVLQRLRTILKPGGTLNILQPNYRYAYKEYFDDFTHVSVYSHLSLCDLLATQGFRVVECMPRFLPLTVKSNLPVSPALIRLYLALPFKPMGKQMLIRAVVA